MIIEGVIIFVAGGALVGSSVFMGYHMAGGGSGGGVYNSSHIRSTIINSLSNIEFQDENSPFSFLTMLAVTLGFIITVICFCSCCPHSLSFYKARQQHIEKIRKLERLQALLTEQLNESRSIVTSVQSLFASTPSAPIINQLQTNQIADSMERMKPKYYSTSCLEKYRLPPLEEEEPEEV